MANLLSTTIDGDLTVNEGILGTTYFKNDAGTTNVLTVYGASQSATSTTTGTLRVSGGISASSQSYIGSNLRVSGSIESTSTNGIFIGGTSSNTSGFSIIPGNTSSTSRTLTIKPRAEAASSLILFRDYSSTNLCTIGGSEKTASINSAGSLSAGTMKVYGGIASSKNIIATTQIAASEFALLGNQSHSGTHNSVICRFLDWGFEKIQRQFH